MVHKLWVLPLVAITARSQPAHACMIHVPCPTMILMLDLAVLTRGDIGNAAVPPCSGSTIIAEGCALQGVPVG